MTTTTSRATTRRRPASKEPGYFTRAEVELALHLTASERETYERAGYFGPNERRERGDTRAVLYSASDLAIGHVAMAAYRAGLRGDSLRQLSSTLRTKRGRLVPGWSGHAVISGEGDLELATQDESLDAVVRRMGRPDVLLVLALAVPVADERKSA